MQKSKKICCEADVPTNKQCLSIDSIQILKARIDKIMMILHSPIWVHHWFKLWNTTQFQITVSSLLECPCPASKETMARFGKKRGSFTYCIHDYYVFIKVCKQSPNFDLFMHAPTLSFNNIKFLTKEEFWPVPKNLALLWLTYGFNILLCRECNWGCVIVVLSHPH